MIFKGDKFEDEDKIIALVKSVYVDEQNQEKEVLRYQLEVKPMVMTEEQEAAFQAATHCYMCEEPFDEERGKVRDQITRKVEGPHYRVSTESHKVCWYNPQG